MDKKYIAPKIEIVRFDTEDVILTSGGAQPTSIIGNKTAAGITTQEFSIFNAE
ncbi:MAG: hypothetical protein IJ366_04680 [Clostridia bacterium]|nr:hypothetical protein [Clostridia bacterium]